MCTKCSPFCKQIKCPWVLVVAIEGRRLKAFVAGALGMGELEKAESILLATLPGGRRGEVGDLGVGGLY